MVSDIFNPSVTKGLHELRLACVPSYNFNIFPLDSLLLFLCNRIDVSIKFGRWFDFPLVL